MLEQPKRREQLHIEQSQPHSSVSTRKKKPVSEEFFRQSDLSANVGKTRGYERFSVGDRVSHLTFGKGTVLSVREVGADLLYEIAFDLSGTKKLMATYAKLKACE